MHTAAAEAVLWQSRSVGVGAVPTAAGLAGLMRSAPVDAATARRPLTVFAMVGSV